MTTKRKAQARARGKGKPKDERTPEEMLVISPNEAADLIEQIRDADLYDDDEAVAAFLLVIHSIVYTDSPVERELYLHTATRVLMTYTAGFQEAADKLLEEAACRVKRETLKEGGATCKG